ncbi:MAG: hypothetical protein ACREGB_05225 [Candidatus Saccharimonadales bacterium]
MFWLTMLGVAGGAWLAVDALAAYIGLALILAIPMFVVYEIIMGFNGFDKLSGLNLVMVHSWQWLSGVHDPTKVVPSCPMTSTGSWTSVAVLLVMLVILVINIFFGLVTIIGLPVGIGTSFAGSVVAASTLVLAKKESAELSKNDSKFLATFSLGAGLAVLCVALAAMILFGLDLRLVHTLGVHYACS